MGKLFKKKEGGHPLLEKLTTKVEGGRPLFNMAKGVADKFTGGMVSKLLPTPTKADVERQQARRQKKSLATSTPSETQPSVKDEPIKEKTIETVEEKTVEEEKNNNKNQTQTKMFDKINTFKADKPKAFWGIVIGTVALIGGIIVAVVKRVKNKTKTAKKH
ncbi:MAG: hypothetical protein HYR91_06210 [Flavobacteriia bacterium]|nr:hypothetical protein [Flavobacteriia bacterium]